MRETNKGIVRERSVIENGAFGVQEIEERLTQTERDEDWNRALMTFIK